MTSVIAGILSNGITAMGINIKVADPDGIATKAAAEMDQKGVRNCTVKFNLDFPTMTATATSVTYTC